MTQPMTTGERTMECSEFRLLAGGDPRHLDAAAEAHRAACPRCAEFLQQTLGMDAVIRRALEVPVTERVEARAAPQVVAFPSAVRVALGDRRRWMALAASIVGGVLVGTLLWLASPRHSLARDLVEHMGHEPLALASSAPADPAVLDAVLEREGIRLRPGPGTVSYARSCEFRGQTVPHLVVQTDHGPVTVMVLRNERPSSPVDFNEQGYSGRIVPAGPGSIAVIGGAGTDVGQAAAEVLAAVTWR